MIEGHVGLEGDRGREERTMVAAGYLHSLVSHDEIVGGMRLWRWRYGKRWKSRGEGEVVDICTVRKN